MVACCIMLHHHLAISPKNTRCRNSAQSASSQAQSLYSQFLSLHWTKCLYRFLRQRSMPIKSVAKRPQKSHKPIRSMTFISNSWHWTLRRLVHLLHLGSLRICESKEPQGSNRPRQIKQRIHFILVARQEQTNVF